MCCFQGAVDVACNARWWNVIVGGKRKSFSFTRAHTSQVHAVSQSEIKPFICYFFIRRAMQGASPLRNAPSSIHSFSVSRFPLSFAFDFNFNRVRLSVLDKPKPGSALADRHHQDIPQLFITRIVGQIELVKARVRGGEANALVAQARSRSHSLALPPAPDVLCI